MPRPAPVVAALLIALFASVWLAGEQQRLRVVLVAAQGADRQWLATVHAGLRVAYGDSLAVQFADWHVDLTGLPHEEGAVGPAYAPLAILGRVPRVAADPLVAVVCDVDLAPGSDAAVPWIHGTAQPEGRMIVSVRRVRAEHADPDDVRARVAFLGAHEFGHLLGNRHSRDGSLMGPVRPGVDPLAGARIAAAPAAGEGPVRSLRLAPEDPTTIVARSFLDRRDPLADVPRLRLSAEDRFELPVRRLVRARVPSSAGAWLTWLLPPLLTLPGAAACCLIWDGLRRRFGSARVHGKDLALALVLNLAAVGASHYGWSVLGPLLALLAALGGRLVPAFGGAAAGALACGLGLLLGAAGALADLGYLYAAPQAGIPGLDAESIACVLGGALAVQAVRASWARPVEGRAGWGDLWGPAIAALFGAGIALAFSSPATALGGAAAGFALARLHAVPALRIDLARAMWPKNEVADVAAAE